MRSRQRYVREMSAGHVLLRGTTCETRCSGTSAAGSARLVLVAVILAAAMMFINQTIVTLAIPDLRMDLSLSAATQGIVNGYLLSLAALLMLGGKLPRRARHRRTKFLLARARVEETEPVATATSVA
jgi:hypothetical protein